MLVQLSTFIYSHLLGVITVSCIVVSNYKHSLKLNAVIPTNALLIFNGMNITNESIQVTQGAALQVACRGGQGSTWKMGAINIRFSASANVYQLKSPISSYLFIKSVKPPNAGTYTCHIDGTQEYVTVGESLICY